MGHGCDGCCDEPGDALTSEAREKVRTALYQAGATRGMTYGYDDMDGHLDRLTDAVAPFVTAAYASGKALVAEEVDGFLDDHEFHGNALAKAACDGYVEMLRAHLRAVR